LFGWISHVSYQHIAEENLKKIALNEEVGRLLSYMLSNPEKFGVSHL
jgi:hypothetical protein